MTRNEQIGRYSASRIAVTFRESTGFFGVSRPLPSGWKAPVGKRLTDKRIAHYEKEGYYGTNGIIALQKAATRQKVAPKVKKQRFQDLFL